MIRPELEGEPEKSSTDEANSSAIEATLTSMPSENAEERSELTEGIISEPAETSPNGMEASSSSAPIEASLHPDHPAKCYITTMQMEDATKIEWLVHDLGAGVWLHIPIPWRFT